MSGTKEVFTDFHTREVYMYLKYQSMQSVDGIVTSHILTSELGYSAEKMSLVMNYQMFTIMCNNIVSSTTA